jgi:hypothetical protein
MRKPTPFLIFSSLAVAALGTSAAKISKRVIPYYYQKGSICQMVNQESGCAHNGGDPCKYVTAGGTSRNIFQNRNIAGTICSNQLFVLIP